MVVPDYPVYYAPRGDVNLFFYDGMYWAYQRDNWYASTWYNGPWGLVGPEYMPVFVLRIPVRYYRHPPVAWVSWGREAPPRWGERWGHDWEQRRSGWDGGTVALLTHPPRCRRTSGSTPGSGTRRWSGSKRCSVNSIAISRKTP